LKIVHSSDVPPIPSDKVGISGAEGLSVRPLVTQADGAQTYSMTLLELAPGGSTPKHSHQRDEEIFVRTGNGTVKYADKEASVSPGSVLYIGPNEDHQFLNTTDEILELLCVTLIQAG